MEPISHNGQEPKSISHNGLKKILVIGKTGTGKSSLCNVLAGKEYDADYFPTSSEGTSCTQKTKFKDVFLNGDQKKPVSLIDTMGFDDPTKDHDAKIIDELVAKLKTRCDYVHMFVLAVNGQSPRLEGSLLTMIKILEGMFTKQFWNQTVLVFTRMPMNLRDKEKREKKINKKTDEEFAADFIKIAEEQFGDRSGLGYLFMDAIYEKDDDDEKKAFDSACTKLYEMLEELPGLSTDYVKKVETDNALLQQKIKEKEAETETLQAQVKKLKADADVKKVKTDNALLQQKIKEKKQQIRKVQNVAVALGVIGAVVTSIALFPVAAPLEIAALAIGGGLTLLGGGAMAKAMVTAAGKLNLYYSIH